MSIEVDTVTLPACYASAFVNGDYSGLSGLGVEHAKALEALLARDDWRIVDVARDDDGEALPSRFTWSFRFYGGECDGGDVLDYIVHKINP